MRIHISLVGEQLAPIYAGIQYSDPEEVYLVCSTSTMPKAQRLQSLLSDKTVHIIPFDATDLVKIYSSLELLSSRFSLDDILSINLVGGTKHWAISFFDYFSKREGTTFFLGNQDNQIWDLSSRTWEKVSIPMEMQFKLQGQMPDSYMDFREYTLEDDIVATQAEQIWMNPKYKRAFTTLTSNIKDNKVPDGFSFDSNGTDFVVFHTPDGKSVEFRSPHADKLVRNTSWFEYKVARLLCKWADAKTIWCNCVFRFDIVIKDKSGKVMRTPQDMNEIDIVVYNGSKLLFVECKTFIHNLTDIDKFKSVVRNYGGLASKPVFITWYEPAPDKRKKLKLNDTPYIALSKVDEETLYEKLDEILEGNSSR